MGIVAIALALGVYTLWYAKAFAYLSDEPAACVNCHVMNDNFHSWVVSSHRTATCNDCHLPHDGVAKYMAKIENGVRHAAAFTFENVQTIRITEPHRQQLQQNCVRCHQASVDWVIQFQQGSEMTCTKCHQGAGHVF